MLWKRNFFHVLYNTYYLLEDRNSNKNKVIFHCGFNLHSLMINSFDHLFHTIPGYSHVPFWEVSVHIICPLLIRLYLLAIELFSPLCILDIKRYVIYKYFLSFIRLSISVISFPVERRLCLIHYDSFLFFICALRNIFKNLCRLLSYRFSAMFTSSNSAGLYHMVESSIHFELTLYERRVQYHSSVCRYPVILTSFIEETIHYPILCS